MKYTKDVLTTFGMKGASFFFQFLTTIVVSRFLTPTEVGAFLISLAIATILQSVREFGIVSYVIQETALTKEKIGTVFAFALISGAMLGSGLLFSKGWIAQFYNSEGVETALSILAIAFFIYPFGLPATALMRREKDFRSLAIVVTSSSFCGFVLSSLLSIRGFGATSLALGNLASSFVFCASAILFRPDHLRLRPSLAAWRSVMAFGLRSSLASIVLKAGVSGIELIVGKFMGLHSAAILVRARTLPNFVEAMICVPINIALVPDIAARMRSSQEITSKLLRMTEASLIVSWVILALIGANAEQVVFLVFGPNWIEVVPILQVLCLAQAWMSVSGIAKSYFEATGKVGKILQFELLVAAFLISVVVLGQQLGLLLLSWFWVASSVLTTFLYWGGVVRELQIELIQLAKVFLLPLFLVVTVLFLQVGLETLLGFSFWAESLLAVILLVFCKVASSGLLVVGILAYNKHILFQSAVALWKRTHF